MGSPEGSKPIIKLTRQKKKLLREKYHNDWEDSHPEGVPIISGKTIGSLETLYCMNPDQLINRTIYPYPRGLEIAASYMSFFQQGEKENGMFYQTCIYLDSSYPLPLIQLKDAATVGIAVVIKAFHTQYGERFIENLRQSEPAQLMKAYGKPKGSFLGRAAIIDRLRSTSGIPEYQANLCVFLDSYRASYVPSIVEEAFMDGSITAYNVIATLWPHLSRP